MSTPRILFAALREPRYVRLATALRALRANYAVQQVTSDARAYPLRLPSVLLRLTLESRGYDLYYAGFLGQPLALWLGLLRRRPVVLDAFISLYDTVCFDRHLASELSVVGRLAYWTDRLSLEKSKVVVVDTNAHADFFSMQFSIPRQKIETVYLGYDHHLFAPGSHRDEDLTEIRVFTYSSYLPVHGALNVVRAASLLKSERQITFTVVGTGPTYRDVRREASRLDLSNVRFIDWVPYTSLPSAIASADICLGGHFGSVGKAKRTIAGKTFQFLAMGKATIVGECPANLELLVPGEHALFCKQACPEALAEAISILARSRDLRLYMGERGAELMGRLFHPDVVAERWRTVVERALT